MRLSSTVLIAGLISTGLMACTPSAPSGPSDCSPAAQWRAGLERLLPDPACDSDKAREAHLLGTELAGLRAEFAEVGAQLEEADPARAGVLQRRRRQLQIDIEAIESEARIQGWITR